MPSKEPVGRPAADPRQGGERRDHVVVGKESERVEVEIGTRKPDDVRGLAPREPDLGQLERVDLGDALAGRKGPGDPVAGAVPLDEAAADGCGGTEGDLLRGDRDDERLEGRGVKSRPESGVAVDDRPQHRLRVRPDAERFQVERETEQAADLFGDRSGSGLDVDAARHGRDPDLAALDDPVERPGVPDGRTVAAEVAEARRRELEVVRLRNGEEHAQSAPASWSKSTNGSNATPSTARYSAGPSRAKTRLAARATHRSEKPSPT